MTRKLTREKALKIAKELWDWLAEDGQREKHNWPGWEVVGKMQSDCPLCEYVHLRARTEGGICTACPLYGKWGEAEECSDEGSPYQEWEECQEEKDWEGAAKAAHKVAELMEQELKAKA